MTPPAPARRAPAAALALALLGAASSARAGDLFEIQVYTPEIDAPGHFGLEVHANYTPSGRSTPAFPGETPPDRALRLTLEPSFGVADWLELGFYLQSYMAPGTGVQYGGNKLRAKFVVPERAGLPLLLGVNLEIGRVPKTVDSQGWANEIRPIIGWTDGVWLVDLNPIFGYALSGPDRFRIELEPAAKVSFNTGKGFALGLEYYATLGFADDLAPVREQEHLLLAVFDLAAPPGAPPQEWELNVGVGAGLTPGTPQHSVVKVIFGREF
ncbi:MAG TPA: hypothetical protein VLU43_13025 [Anaeromyxobacteraceae bacterium]|nr:hypothetical protein [Anaeromyxobacteraceae bacterium]